MKEQAQEQAAAEKMLDVEDKVMRVLRNDPNELVYEGTVFTFVTPKKNEKYKGRIWAKEILRKTLGINYPEENNDEQASIWNYFMNWGNFNVGIVKITKEDGSAFKDGQLEFTFDPAKIKEDAAWTFLFEKFVDEVVIPTYGDEEDYIYGLIFTYFQWKTENLIGEKDKGDVKNS